MVDIIIESYEPSFNRLDFIKYIFENTDNTLIESKFLLDKLIEGDEIKVQIPNINSESFLEGLLLLGVIGQINCPR